MSMEIIDVLTAQIGLYIYINDNVIQYTYICEYSLTYYTQVEFCVSVRPKGLYEFPDV